MLLKRFCSVWRGRNKWRKIKKKYDIDNGFYVLLMIDNDRELNELALKHLNDFIEYRHARGVVIVTADRWICENGGFYSNRIIDIVSCTFEDSDALLAYYEFYQFSERMLVVSMNQPYGNCVWQSIGLNGVTKEDIVCLGIYCIRTWSGKVDEAWTITR